MLERAGLITQAHTAEWRPCRPRPEPLGHVIAWLDDHRFWDTSFDRLEFHLRTVQANQEGAHDG